ncbi:unnamed protein product, partial [Iphiclides podalirius]
MRRSPSFLGVIDNEEFRTNPSRAAAFRAFAGKLAPRHQQVVSRLSGGAGGAGGAGAGGAGGAGAAAGAGRGALPGAGHARELLAACLRTEPRARPPAATLLRHKYFTVDGFADSFNAELRTKLGKDIQDNNRSRTNSTAAESLIDYNYTPSTEPQLEAAPASNKHSSVITTPTSDSDEAVVTLPAPRPTIPRSLARVVNETFQVDWVNSKLVMDEDLLRGRVNKKANRNHAPDFSLPYVAGASNSPVKKAKKPFIQHNVKSCDAWDAVRFNGTDVSLNSKTNLPYM